MSGIFIKNKGFRLNLDVKAPFICIINNLFRKDV